VRPAAFHFVTQLHGVLNHVSLQNDIHECLLHIAMLEGPLGKFTNSKENESSEYGVKDEMW